MTPVQVREGDGPIILGQPHSGTFVPAAIFARLNHTGQAMADTDWHVERLYDGLLAGATTVQATFHRYVIDANRPPSGESLYPGQNTTGLCPLSDFDGTPIYRDGAEPSADEIAARRDAFHAPYHRALAEQIARVTACHGLAVLYDCHSIRSAIPFLFEGQLPDLNIGTKDGATAAPEIEAAVAGLAQASPYRSVLNGRFKGGWTTRHYGDPQTGVHAIQMEIAQRTYLAAEAAPWAYDEQKAAQLRPWLGDILRAIAEQARAITEETTP